MTMTREQQLKFRDDVVTCKHCNTIQLPEEAHLHIRTRSDGVWIVKVDCMNCDKHIKWLSKKQYDLICENKITK